MKPYYEKGGITIYNCDCREVLPYLPRESVDMVLTDPPYGMNKDITGDGKDYLKVVGPALQLAWVSMKEGGTMFVFTSTAEVLNVGIAVGMPLTRMLWMYKAGDCSYPHYGWMMNSEAILWFSKGKPRFERVAASVDCFITTHDFTEGKLAHPCIKPLSVVTNIASRCPRDGLILDPFMGSGTTMVAAKQLNRKAIGIEIEERYCEIAAKRLAQEVFDFSEGL